MFTPTTIERRANLFLAPCWQRKQEIAAQHPNLIQPYIVTGDSIAAAYQDAYEYARTKGHDYVLCIEDDILPPPDIIEIMLDTIDTARVPIPVLCGMVMLRPAGTKLPNPIWLPWIGRWNGQAFTSWRPLDDITQQANLVRIDMLANPFIYDTGALSEKRIGFHGSNQDWDLRFCSDLKARGIPAYCVPKLKSKHYCIKTHEVYG
jgi:glycosyltransferase involved in cell wall biosynthesis